MKVKFTEDRQTVKYGPVKAGDKVEVSGADGAAFIASGVAVEITKPKKEK